MTFRPARIPAALWSLSFSLVLGSASVLAACSPARAPLTVSVRDAATGEPAARVAVIAEVPSDNNTFSLATILGTTGPINGRAVTDDRGRATVEYIPGRPVRVGLLEPGWESGFVLVWPESSGYDPGAWRQAQVPIVAPIRLPEFQVTPEGTATSRPR